MRLALARWPLLVSLTLLGACEAGTSDEATPGGVDGAGGAAADPAKPDRTGGPNAPAVERDIVSTDLLLDLTARRGRASIKLARSSAPTRFEIGDLHIESVATPGGKDLAFRTLDDGRLEVDAAASATTVVIDYLFSKHGHFDGWDATPGFTFLWPYFCSNLFPCHSGPADGTKFTLEVAGVPAGKTVVYPEAIPAAAPSYQIGLAVGDYTYESLGKTAAGTEVGLYLAPGGRETALAGGARLTGYFDWLEQSVGPYLFGDAVASVSVDWGPGDFGGLEHHPLWHIDDGQMGDANTHAHEAAHGWYGGGVRIACWEDFVLSEGTVTYLAARAIEAVDGADAGEVQWTHYREDLKAMIADGQDTVAWLPDTCNAIQIAEHPLWSLVIYYKGAFFLRAVEEAVGREPLDAVLAAFYRKHGGAKAARVQDLLDALAEATDFDPSDLAATWLLGSGLPAGF